MTVSGMRHRDEYRVICSHVITVGVTSWMTVKVFWPVCCLAEQEVRRGDTSQKTTGILYYITWKLQKYHTRFNKTQWCWLSIIADRMVVGWQYISCTSFLMIKTFETEFLTLTVWANNGKLKYTNQKGFSALSFFFSLKQVSPWQG